MSNNILSVSVNDKRPGYLGISICNNQYPPVGSGGIIEMPPPLITGSIPLPTDDSNLFLWMSSDTGITHDGNYLMFGTPDWINRGQAGVNDFRTNDFSYTIFNPTASGSLNKPSIDYFSIVSLGVGSYQGNEGGVTNLSSSHSVYLLMYLPTWQSGKYVVDGTNGNDGTIAMFGSTNQMGLYAGLGPTALVTVPIGSWFILSAIFNGATSTLQVNNLTISSGNVGTGIPHRVVTGGYAGGYNSNSNFSLAAIIVSNAANDTTIQTIHKNWLAFYGGLSI